ncbi:glycosyltransferase family 29-domain-containing protein [Pavlovales sp. CCMP2436]|nr:glycosyltransferase family 29-domain-containing protein [Pavlovales sp. CCMP2436]
MRRARVLLGLAAGAWLLLLVTLALSARPRACTADGPRAEPCPVCAAARAAPTARLELQKPEPIVRLELELERPFTPAAPIGLGALLPLAAGMPLVWTRESFGVPPHSDAHSARLDGALASLLPELDLRVGQFARTCAVVGSSGTLLRSGYGPFIDAHELVIRFNGAPAGGIWARDAGAKTSLSVLADVQTRQCINGKATAPPGGGEAERAAAPIAGCDFYAEARTDASAILFIPRRNGVGPILHHARSPIGRRGPRVLVRSDAFGDYVDSRIPAYAEGRAHPTSGFNGVHAALAMCETLDLYGFGTPREHYFSPPREEHDGAQHLYRSEYAYFLSLEVRFPGRVRLWR